MIKIELIGNLGRDAFITRNASGEFVSFSVAHSQKHTDPNGVQTETTIWVSCTLNKYSDSLLQYLKKGTRVFVRGNLSSRLYTDKAGNLQAGLNCSVREIELCGGLLPQAAPAPQTAQTYQSADLNNGRNPYQSAPAAAPQAQRAQPAPQSMYNQQRAAAPNPGQQPAQTYQSNALDDCPF